MKLIYEDGRLVIEPQTDAEEALLSTSSELSAWEVAVSDHVTALLDGMPRASALAVTLESLRQILETPPVEPGDRFSAGGL